MKNDDALVKLAKYCAGSCHVLKNMTKGREADLSGPNKKTIEDLGRYADLVHSSPSTITSGIRTMRNMESMVSERRKGAYDLREHHPSFTEEHLIAWTTELQEILNVLDHQLGLPTISELPQEGVGPDGPHVSGETERHVLESAATETSSVVGESPVPQFLYLPTAPSLLELESSPAPGLNDVPLSQHYARMAQDLRLSLPSTCRWLDPEGVRLVDEQPIAAGGFANIYEATYDSRKVVLKSYRCYMSFDVVQVVAVRYNHSQCRVRC